MAIDQQIFSPAVQYTIEQAQRLATLMSATEFYPEHIVLGALVHHDEEIAHVFNLLELDSRILRRNAETIFRALHQITTPTDTTEPSSQTAVAPSSEVQECLNWATSFSKQQRAQRVEMEHLLPAVMRHPQVQPTLYLLLSSYETLPPYISEQAGQAYTSAFDQLIQTRIRAQKHVTNRSFQQPLTSITRPTLIFQDILGSHSIKQPLRNLVTFLRQPRLFPRQESTSLCNLLVVGHPCTERTLLIQATASEAVVPLITLSISTLVDLIKAIKEETITRADMITLTQDHPDLDGLSAIEVGRQIFHTLFEIAKEWSTCLLLLDNLDAFSQLPKEVREPVQQQLLDEMDGVDWHPPMVIVATARSTTKLDQELICPGHFDRHVSFSESYAIHPAASTKLCLSCKKEVLADWQFCIYCGATLTQSCPNCGAPHIEVEGSRYCYQCGTLLEPVPITSSVDNTTEL